MAAQDINCDGERAFLLQAWLRRDPYGQKTQTAENVVASVPELWIPGYFVNDLLRGVQSGDCQVTNRWEDRYGMGSDAGLH
jgi:hypothetical protein